MTTHPVSRPSRGGRAWFDGAARFLRRIVSGAPPKTHRVRDGRKTTGAPRGGHKLSEDEIDRNSEDSFPASDPPSWSGSGL